MSLPTTIGTMTITAINFVSDNGDWNEKGYFCDLTYEYEYTGTFSSLSIYQGNSSLSMPVVGESYSAGGGSTNVWCSKVSAKLKDGCQPITNSGATSIAVVVFHFDSIDAQRMDLSPLSRPPQFRGGTLNLQEFKRTDVLGNPMVNSVGDYYEGMGGQFIPGMSTTVSWNVADNPLTSVGGFANAVNSAAWNGLAAYKVMTGAAEVEQRIEKFNNSDITYYVISITITWRTDDGVFGYSQPENYGDRYLPTSGSDSPIPNVVNGVHGPCFLALDGTKLPDGDDPVIFPAAAGSTPAGYLRLQAVDFSTSLPDIFSL